jgi:hypothetical protein
MLRNARALRALFCLVAMTLAGCGASTGSVTGKVTLNGETVTGGTVTFIGSDQKVVTAPISVEGEYTIPKIPPGTAKIGVTPLPTLPKGKGMDMMDPSKMGGGAEKPSTATPKPMPIPKRYENPEKSGLTYTVTKGSQEHDIKLEGK